MRTGVVPTSVLPRLRLPVQLALGGRLGSGRQWWSWVALDDVVGAYHHAVMTDALSGPVNLAAPDPVTNADFVRTLARVLGRPAAVRAPAPLVRVVAGELADALVLASLRVSSAKLEASGFRFLHRELEPALRAELGRL
jgi:NAD dependent epimerase/dehydratase family enzyme